MSNQTNHGENVDSEHIVSVLADGYGRCGSSTCTECYPGPLCRYKSVFCADDHQCAGVVHCHYELYFPEIMQTIWGEDPSAYRPVVLHSRRLCGGDLFDNIFLVLVMRALVGIGVGIIMPLSTGLLSYYFKPEQQVGLMGYSSAMNQMGGVIATLLSGLLANISWRVSFLVYLMGIDQYCTVSHLSAK